MSSRQIQETQKLLCSFEKYRIAVLKQQWPECNKTFPVSPTVSKPHEQVSSTLTKSCMGSEQI